MNGYNFTERLRRVLGMANAESRRLHHEYVGTEHLLLGLIRDDEGVAAAVLLNLHVDLSEIRRVIDTTVLPGRASSEGELPYTSRAKKALELSMAEARDLHHNYVGTEHLLMGLLREEKGIAAQVLIDAGVTVDAARSELVRLLGGSHVSEARTFTATVNPMFPAELDALIAAPDFHRLLLENENVRILDTRIPPGVTTPLHTHRWPAAHYIQSWSHFVRRNEAGEVLLDTRQTDFNQSIPQALWGLPLTAHTLENVGSTDLHVISVEIKPARTVAGW